MIVMLSARRLKPGAWEQFRNAWDPGDAMPPGFQRAYHARNIRDEDEVVSFVERVYPRDGFQVAVLIDGADDLCLCRPRWEAEYTLPEPGTR